MLIVLTAQIYAYMKIISLLVSRNIQDLEPNSLASFTTKCVVRKFR